MSWSVPREGWCLSGSDDKLICMWDINASPSSEKSIEPLRIFKSHEAVVEDVAWHPTEQDIFASVSDDKFLMLWDQRKDRPTTALRAHDLEVNAVAWNPKQGHILATAGNDAVVKLWDARKLSVPIHVMKNGHQKEIYNLSWNKSIETILASGSIDRRVILWDISRIGDEQSKEEAEDGPPELFFIHGGHTDRLNDISWNPNDPWVMASVGEDNILQVWQVAETLRKDDEATPAKESSPK